MLSSALTHFSFSVSSLYFSLFRHLNTSTASFNLKVSTVKGARNLFWVFEEMKVLEAPDRHVSLHSQHVNTAQQLQCQAVNTVSHTGVL